MVTAHHHKTTDSSINKILRFFCICFYGSLVLVSFPLSLWLLMNAITRTGRIIAVTSLLLILYPIFAHRWFRHRSKPIFWHWILIFITGCITAGFAAILLSTPSGIAIPESAVKNRFTQPTSFPRFALTNIIPEAEQINLGFQVMPYLDPIMTVEQSRQTSTFTLDIYKRMENDPNFKQLGSAMGWAYAELLDQPFDVGHYYLYIPKSTTNKALPAIVFLHGSFGNFKAYTWVWSKLAEEQGIVIISPSYGFGNWWQSGGSEAVLRAIEDAATQVEIDHDQIYLAGLSNGGLGVSQLAVSQPEMFQGLILISPVFDTSISDQPAFLRAWQNRPVLLISGQKDRRIPIDYIQKRVKNLQSGGVNLTTIIYPNEDHFLFFSQPDNILDNVVNWLAETNEAP
jgi:pimeloyl-ACP methyl ester carboxylesterase